jgi:hypothetical protein
MSRDFMKAAGIPTRRIPGKKNVLINFWTGSTGSIGYFSQFPDETGKSQSAFSGTTYYKFFGNKLLNLLH